MAAIGLNQLAKMCQQIGMALRAGLDIRKVWEHEAARGSQRHQQRAREVLEHINAGHTLAEAMRSVRPYFPALTCDLVEVGETAGRLEEVFLKLADHYEHMVKLRRQFFGDIAWPAIQLVMATLVIGGMIWAFSVLPETPVPILGLSGTRGLMIYATVVCSVLGSLIWLGMAIAKGWLGTGPITLITKIPVIGDCIKTMAIARFSWTFSMALNAGVDARKSMKLALRSTHNRFFSSQQEPIDLVLQQGQSFHEALRNSGVFPQDFLDTFETAEISGTQSESLEQVASYYQEKAESATKILTRIASFLIYLVTVVIIVALIIKLFYALYLNPINEILNDL